MKILAITTSQAKTAVALGDGTTLRMVEFPPARTGEVLREHVAPFMLENPELIAVDIGPGSYTGTRVGVAFGQGLAAARNLPWVGISAWDALSLISPAGHVVVVSSRSGETLQRTGDGEVLAMPLGDISMPVFGYPTLDPVKFGGRTDQAGVVPDLRAYLEAMMTLAQRTNAQEALPVYHDRFSTKDSAR